MADAPESPFRPDLFAGQVAFVTGGATGIGKEICRVLGSHGARIAIASRKREVLEMRRRSSWLPTASRSYIDSCDVRDAAAVQRVVEGVVERYGRLDIVVNNAAGNSPRSHRHLAQRLQGGRRIDLLGTFNVSKAAFDAWLGEHGGNIVNISAPFEMKGAAMQSHVAAAKAGVDSSLAPRRGVGAVWDSGQRDRARHDRRNRRRPTVLRKRA